MLVTINGLDQKVFALGYFTHAAPCLKIAALEVIIPFTRMTLILAIQELPPEQAVWQATAWTYCVVICQVCALTYSA